MSDFFIAVDLGGTNLRIAAVDEQGKLMEKISLSAKVARDPRSVIADMCGAIARLREKYRGTSSAAGHWRRHARRLRPANRSHS